MSDPMMRPVRSDRDHGNIALAATSTSSLARPRLLVPRATRRTTHVVLPSPHSRVGAVARQMGSIQPEPGNVLVVLPPNGRGVPPSRFDAAVRQALIDVAHRTE